MFAEQQERAKWPISVQTALQFERVRGRESEREGDGENLRCRQGADVSGTIDRLHCVFRQQSNFGRPVAGPGQIWLTRLKLIGPGAKMRANEIRIEWLRKVIYPALERREAAAAT